MTEDLRSMVISRFSANANVWTDLLESIYVLTLKDWIGCLGASKREGIPGIWGHSYVRTFNDWIGKPPAEPLEMEGGIATSYFVLKGLNGFLTRLGSGISSPLLNELTTFLIARTKPEGTGVQTTGIRGYTRIDTNIRHTCFAYLIMREMATKKLLTPELQAKCELTASIIIEPVSQRGLLTHFLNESWPIGAIAAYIHASDGIASSRFGRSREKEWQVRWNSVRCQLIEALASITSKRINNLRDGLELSSDPAFVEYQPFWHPINNLKILELHSTLGCLSLVGRDVAKTITGRKRIQSLVAALRDRVLSANDKAPRFDETSPPSIAAACAMLKLVLGEWYEPSPRDFELTTSILVFIEENWDNPEAYNDYWSEFTVPILNLEEIHQALGLLLTERFVERGLLLGGIQDQEETRILADHIMQLSSVRKALLQIEPKALGTIGGKVAEMGSRDLK